jgi:hypothetical protein
MSSLITRSAHATVGLLMLVTLGCSDADRKIDRQAESGNKVVLLGDNYGAVKVEELGEVIVSGEVEKSADITRVLPRENAPPDRTFDVPPGKYRAYRLKVGEKLLGKVFTTRNLADGAMIKDLRSVGWIRLDGKRNGGIGEMTGMPVLVMEGCWRRRERGAPVIHHLRVLAPVATFGVTAWSSEGLAIYLVEGGVVDSQRRVNLWTICPQVVEGDDRR